MDDSLQFMREFRHPAYRDSRAPRILTTRSGLGQQVLSIDSKFVLFNDAENDASGLLTPENVPTYVSLSEGDEDESSPPTPKRKLGDPGDAASPDLPPAPPSPSRLSELKESIYSPYSSVMYTAVHDHTGRPLAVVETSSREKCVFKDHQVKVIRALSLIAASAMRSARLHEEMASARKHSVRSLSTRTHNPNHAAFKR